MCNIRMYLGQIKLEKAYVAIIGIYAPEDGLNELNMDTTNTYQKWYRGLTQNIIYCGK